MIKLKKIDITLPVEDPNYSRIGEKVGKYLVIMGMSYYRLSILCYNWK